MNSGGKCGECGTALSADSPEGFCARCLLELGLESAGGNSPKAGPQVESPGEQIGQYLLLEEIGHGGCGVVYRAQQVEPVRRKVALKVIKLGMDTRQVVGRFEAERQALALMDHPNIAKVLDAGATETGRPFFVMELVSGLKITDYCEQNRLDLRQRLDLFVQVCRAIQHAHQKGVIHRDIKPSNILVAAQDPDGPAVPKVIDFGIAKATQGRLTDQTLFTAFEQFLGTPAYMSPEQTQVGRLDVDTRSDIYSLGVLLYELLAGRTPFDTKELAAAGLDEMRRTIREVEPVRPSTRLMAETAAGRKQKRETGTWELVKLLRGDLDWIVMKCLEKDRARRYETANGLAMDIQRYLNNEPVLARPPSKLYEFKKTLRRHKFGFGATALVILALGAGVVVSSFQVMRARKAEREALAAHQDAADKLWSSYRAEARALRFAGQSGRHFKSLEVLRQAAAMRPSLELRNEAIASMVLPDIQEKCQKDFSPQRSRTVADPRCQNYAVCDRAGVLSIRRLTDDRELGRLPTLSSVARAPLLFSADGRWLGVQYADTHVRVWDWAKADLALDVTSCEKTGFDFAPDSRRVGISDATNLLVFDVATGAKLLGMPLQRFGASLESPGLFKFDPAGQRLALHTVGQRTNVFVLDVESGTVLNTLATADPIFGVAWHPGGKYLAAATATGLLVIWDPVTGERLKAFHVDQLVSVCFNHEGNLLATAGWDSKTRLWSFPNCRMEASILSAGNLLGFSPDDSSLATLHWTGTGFDLFDIASGHDLRTLQESPEAQGGIGGSVVLDPSGILLAWPAPEGTGVCDLFAGKQDHLAVAGTVPLGFDVASENLLLSGPEGLLRCPVRRNPSASDSLLGNPSSVYAVTRASGVVSPDGRLCAVVEARGTCWRILRTDTFAEVTRTGPQPGTAQAVFNPAANLLATSAFHFSGVKVWDARTGELVKRLPAGDDFVDPGASICFSPDGHYLVISTGSRDLFFWDTRAWSLERRLTLPGDAGFFSSMAFSRDGRVFAATYRRNVIHLYSVATSQPLADLEAPDSRHISSLAFSGDGTRLAACESRDALRIWNLREIRQQLAGLGLDWDQSPHSAANASPAAVRVSPAGSSPTASVSSASH